MKESCSEERRRHHSHPELQTGACTASLQTSLAAQCTDLYVSPEILFLIKMVVSKGLSLMQVQVGPEDLEELVGVISWGLRHHIMVSLDLCWVVLTKPMIVVGHRISSSNSISLSPGPPGTKFCTDLLLQETVPALTGAHLWPTTHPPPIISLIFLSSPKTLLQSKTHLKR